MLQEHFGGLCPLAEGEFVADDGFDVLEKEVAQEFFANKSWQDLLSHLRDIEGSPTKGGAYMLEGWSVLEPRAISYFARAYLEHLLDTVESSNPDQFYVSSFFGNLYQVVYSRRLASLPSNQVELLRTAAQCVATGLWAPMLERDYAPHAALLFLIELDAKGLQ